MRVAIRDGRRVIVKDCPVCGEEKVCSFNVEESGYHLRREKGRVVGWQSYCKECAVAEQLRWRRNNPDKISALRSRRHAERMKSDAAYRAKRRARRRAEYERIKSDPDALAAYRAAHREYGRQTKERDPRAFLERRRMEYALRRERMGRPVRVQGQRGYGGRLEAQPFVSWLKTYQAATGAPSAEELARDLGLGAKRVSSLLAGNQASVAFDLVDHALQHARFPILLDGELVVRIDDLYPYEEEAAA